MKTNAAGKSKCTPGAWEQIASFVALLLGLRLLPGEGRFLSEITEAQVNCLRTTYLVSEQFLKQQMAVDGPLGELVKSVSVGGVARLRRIGNPYTTTSCPCGPYK